MFNSDDYSDIINLPHPDPKRHARMSMMNRAAQFASFKALSGFEASIEKRAEEFPGSYGETEYSSDVDRDIGM